MPRYELMYLLGSHVAENEVSGIASQILKAIDDFGGQQVRETHLGKKKLAYPIKKTRNGFYVVVNFEMLPAQIKNLDAKIHSMDSSIIRYLIINLEEHLKRQAKDKVEQAKLTRRPGAEDVGKPKPHVSKPAPVIKLEDIDEKTLDEKIEKALSEDLTK